LPVAFTASAIELSLKENRVQNGSIGFVDIQRIYKSFPETIKARENLNELMHQAEDQLNLRKAELLRLRSELSTLKIEREFLARTPILISTTTALVPPAQSGNPITPGTIPPLGELNSRIAFKAGEIAQREVAFKEQQSLTEKGLVDIESRKTEMLLNRIHKAIQEVAQREGISVVIDKTNVLFGHETVDLTEKVLQFLRGA
jgi:Skp family chaperone for outer membrane proteins